MIHYADTSFLCSSYRRQEHTPKADRIREALTEPLHFTSLLEFEFLQAIELQVWLNSRDKSKGYRRPEADRMIHDWESDIATGINRLVPFDMNAVLRQSKFFIHGNYGQRWPPHARYLPRRHRGAFGGEMLPHL